MANIPKEITDEIRKKLDIVEVISNYVHLEQKGKNYFGICPFHDDNNPSMSVSPEKQCYKCFSCGAAGNVFSFVADFKHIGYYDAVRLLGNQLGYNLGSSNLTPQKNEKLYNIYEIACKFYQNNLNTVLGKNAMEYLSNRKIDKDSIKKFRIGLSIPSISLTSYLLQKDISLKELIELGLSNEKGNDVFINRIMFPLYDLNGNVVGFSGRIYNTKDQSKYINTQETQIFKKGTILYNYHNAKELLKKNDSIIVMEGFMDVIRSNTINLNNCVATMGTALTKQNANLLKRTANNIILCFDGDRAGKEATIKAIEVFKEIDVTPKIIRLEEELDPDEYILKYGEEKFKSKIENPINTIDFLMKIHRENKNFKDDIDVSKYIKESLKDLVHENDSILIELTLNKLSKEFEISIENLKKEYNILLNEQIKSNKKNQEAVSNLTDNNQNQQKTSQYEKASMSLIYYMLITNKIIDLVEEKITFFPNAEIRELANKIIYYYHKYHEIDIADFISYIADDAAELKLFNKIINLNLNNNYTREEIEDYIRVINSYPSKKRISDLNKLLKEEPDPLKQANILNEILSLKGVK